MGALAFYVGLHHPHVAGRFDRAFISVNTLRRRKGPFPANRWVMDSGAFTEISTHGRYRHNVAEYAAEIRRWIGVGTLEAVVAQDWMCEPFIVAKTGLVVAEHQRLTIERYDALLAENLPVPILPVLQGYAPHEYVRHIEMYGDRLTAGQWVGVGSVCKRNASPDAIVAVLAAIKSARPDLRLHGFGLKLTALRDPRIRTLLHSADSMAWSFAARREGRNGNDWREADAYRERVEAAIALPGSA